jgi:hypothetical protein
MRPAESCRAYWAGIVWITCDANSLSDLFIANIVQPQGICGFASSLSRERDHWPSGQDGPHVNLNLINEPVVKGLAKDFAATFDQHAGNAALSEILQHGS